MRRPLRIRAVVPGPPVGRRRLYVARTVGVTRAPGRAVVADSDAMEIHIFKHAPDTVALAPGDVLFREGDAGDVMFAVVEGHLDLTRDGARIEEIGPGGILGELALVDPAPRGATAQARTPAKVARVDRQRFVYLVQEHPTFALHVMAVIAQRLRSANERT